MLDLVTLDPATIMAILSQRNCQIQVINKRESRLLVAFYHWYHDIAAQMVDNDVPDSYWFAMTSSDFKTFRRKRLPALTSTSRSSKTSAMSDGDVNVDAVMSF